MNAFYEQIIVTCCWNMIAVLGMSVLTGFTRLFSFGNAGFIAIGAYTSAIMSKQLKSLVGTKRGEVCRIVSKLKREGVPICSCNDGYFYPRSYSEVLDVVSRFSQYGSTLKATSSALRSSSVKS